MRRVLGIAAVVLLIAGCGLMPSPERRAGGAARDHARLAADKVRGRFHWPPRDVGHLAADVEGVEVLRATAIEGGTRLVVRTSGSAPADSWDTEEATVRHCFELKVVSSADTPRPRRVDCPDGAPMTFGPWPKAPDVPYEPLLKALPRVPDGGTVSEARVRAAVASLRLDPRVHAEFVAGNGVVGGRLWAKPRLADVMDCVLFRVAPGRTTAWSPSRIQRMPGEGGCGVGQALG